MWAFFFILLDRCHTGEAPAPHIQWLEGDERDLLHIIVKVKKPKNKQKPETPVYQFASHLTASLINSPVDHL